MSGLTDIGLSYSKSSTTLFLRPQLTRVSRDGDLSSSPQQSELSPLYSFSLQQSAQSQMQLAQRLDLGVSDAGIIGRRVSVMTSSTSGPLTVAEGIIGWN